MKVAVFTKNNKLVCLQEENIHVIIFNIEEDKVVGVDNIILEQHTYDAIIDWLYHNSIDQIYISKIDNQVHIKLSLKGIQVKTFKSLRNDKLYNTLALSVR